MELEGSPKRNYHAQVHFFLNYFNMMRQKDGSGVKNPMQVQCITFFWTLLLDGAHALLGNHKLVTVTIVSHKNTTKKLSSLKLASTNDEYITDFENSTPVKKRKGPKNSTTVIFDCGAFDFDFSKIGTLQIDIKGLGEIVIPKGVPMTHGNEIVMSNPWVHKTKCLKNEVT